MLSDFFDLRERFVVGGEYVDVRPLSVEQILRLWDALRQWIPRWCGFLVHVDQCAVCKAATAHARACDRCGAAEECSEIVHCEDADRSWIDPVYRRAALEIWQEKGARWVMERLVVGTVAEIQGLYDWYVETHDWPRIFREILSLEADEEGNPVDVTEHGVDPLIVLYRLEQRTGRRIEDQLGMRAEAWVSWRDMVLEDMKEEREIREEAEKLAADVARSPNKRGRRVSVKQLQNDPMALFRTN